MKLAGKARVELTFWASETPVLPLYDFPMVENQVIETCRPACKAGMLPLSSVPHRLDTSWNRPRTPPDSQFCLETGELTPNGDNNVVSICLFLSL